MKIIVATLSLVMALLLNACGKEADQATESPAQAPATEQVAAPAQEMPAQEMKEEAASETMTEGAATSEDEAANGEAEAATGEAATMTEGTAEDAGTMEAMPQAEEANEQPAAEESK